MGGEGVRGLAAASVEGAGAGMRGGFILYLMRAGLVAVRVGGPSQERRAGGPRERRKAFDGAQPSLSAVRAAFGIGSEDPNEEGFHGFRFARCWSGGIEGDPAGGEVLGAVAIGEEAIASVGCAVRTRFAGYGQVLPLPQGL